MEITQIVWTVLIGIGAAAVYLWYNRRFLGVFVRKLLEIDAASPETAVTAEELHCRMTPPLRSALREDGALYGAVLVTDGETPRYYIAPQKREMLKVKYRDEQTNPVHIILILCLLVVVGVLFTVLYPIVSEFAQNLLNAE